MNRVIDKTIDGISECFHHRFIFAVKRSVGNDANACLIFKTLNHIINESVVFMAHRLYARAMINMFNGWKMVSIPVS